MKKRVESEEIRKIQDVPMGEFVRIMRKDGTPMKKVWILDEYDKSSRAYAMHNFDDVCEDKYLKKDREVMVGFTF